jgi:14-3-3 protein epsilon
MSDPGQEIADLVYFCTVYHHTHRDKEAIETLKRLIELEPVFDKGRRSLFQAIYKQVIDSTRSTLSFVSAYYDLDCNLSNLERANFLRAKKEDLCAKLLPVCKEAIQLIDQVLLPNAPDSQTLVFFNKLKGDFYRYVAEYSDETESVAAANCGEESYTAAFAASNALPRADPVRLSLILNAAVFKYEIQKEIANASQMIESAVAEMQNEASFRELDRESQREAYEVLSLMKQNLEVWNEEHVGEDAE